MLPPEAVSSTSVAANSWLLLLPDVVVGRGPDQRPVGHAFGGGHGRGQQRDPDVRRQRPAAHRRGALAQAGLRQAQDAVAPTHLPGRTLGARQQRGRAVAVDAAVVQRAEKQQVAGGHAAVAHGARQCLEVRAHAVTGRAAHQAVAGAHGGAGGGLAVGPARAAVDPGDGARPGAAAGPVGGVGPVGRAHHVVRLAIGRHGRHAADHRADVVVVVEQRGGHADMVTRGGPDQAVAGRHAADHAARGAEGDGAGAGGRAVVPPGAGHRIAAAGQRGGAAESEVLGGAGVDEGRVAHRIAGNRAHQGVGGADGAAGTAVLQQAVAAVDPGGGALGRRGRVLVPGGGGAPEWRGHNGTAVTQRLHAAVAHAVAVQRAHAVGPVVVEALALDVAVDVVAAICHAQQLLVGRGLLHAGGRCGADQAVAGRDGAGHAGRATAPGDRATLAVPLRIRQHEVAVAQLGHAVDGQAEADVVARMAAHQAVAGRQHAAAGAAGQLAVAAVDPAHRTGLGRAGVVPVRAGHQHVAIGQLLEDGRDVEHEAAVDPAVAVRLHHQGLWRGHTVVAAEGGRADRAHVGACRPGGGGAGGLATDRARRHRGRGPGRGGQRAQSVAHCGDGGVVGVVEAVGRVAHEAVAAAHRAGGVAAAQPADRALARAPERAHHQVAAAVERATQQAHVVAGGGQVAGDVGPVDATTGLVGGGHAGHVRHRAHQAVAGADGAGHAGAARSQRGRALAGVPARAAHHVAAVGQHAHRGRQQRVPVAQRGVVRAVGAGVVVAAAGVAVVHAAHVVARVAAHQAVGRRHRCAGGAGIEGLAVAAVDPGHRAEGHGALRRTAVAPLRAQHDVVAAQAVAAGAAHGQHAAGAHRLVGGRAHQAVAAAGGTAAAGGAAAPGHRAGIDGAAVVPAGRDHRVVAVGQLDDELAHLVARRRPHQAVGGRHRAGPVGVVAGAEAHRAGLAAPVRRIDQVVAIGQHPQPAGDGALLAGGAGGGEGAAVVVVAAVGASCRPGCTSRCRRQSRRACCWPPRPRCRARRPAARRCCRPPR